MSTTEPLDPATLIPVVGQVEEFSRFGLAGRSWTGLNARFSNARERLSAVGTDPGPIAHIDMGERVAHPDLAGRITGGFSAPNPSASGHAMEVAGVLAACCDAKLHYYNVFDNRDLHPPTMYAALEDVARKRTRVLNISIGSPINDPEIAVRIQACLDNGVIVVAAMGEGYNVPLFPAAYDGVIAVAGINPHGRAIKESNNGLHAFIAAPGENIRVVMDADSHIRKDGTSYATPMVSAAVWLALRHVPAAFNWAAMRTLLQESVEVPGAARNGKLGFGMLDLERLADNLNV